MNIVQLFLIFWAYGSFFCVTGLGFRASNPELGIVYTLLVHAFSGFPLSIVVSTFIVLIKIITKGWASKFSQTSIKYIFLISCIVMTMLCFDTTSIEHTKHVPIIKFMQDISFLPYKHDSYTAGPIACIFTGVFLGSFITLNAYLSILLSLDKKKLMGCDIRLIIYIVSLLFSLMYNRKPEDEFIVVCMTYAITAAMYTILMSFFMAILHMVRTRDTHHIETT